MLLKISIALFFYLSAVRCTPLDDYVNTPDPHYRYELLKTYEMPGFKLHILNLTSQKWQDESVVSNPLWWHFLCITIPDKIKRPDAGFMLIDGGSIHADRLPQPDDNFVRFTSMFALETGSIGADLQQIPNQPTVFKADPTQRQRGEDKIIAWTWKTFLENPNDPSILLRLPMTKAAVRGMDAVTSFVKDQIGIDVKKFMIAGASKRGWTTWTTAAVDKRVFIAAPIVMDMLSLNKNFHNHYRSLGGWTFAFNDYYQLNITRKVDSYEMFAMQRIVDPMSYFDRYIDKKLLVINTAGDEFFLGDDTKAFWSDLVAATNGSVLFRRVPNAEHSCAGHEINIFLTLRSMFLSVYDKQNLPIVRWQMPNNKTHGIIKAFVDLKTGRRPSIVKVYFAKTLDNKRRDFRLLIADPKDASKPIPHPVVWTTANVLRVNEESDRINYEASFLNPIDYWLGFFIEFSFPGIDDTILQVTTETNIIPEYYPFEDCTLETCRGKLV